MSIRTTVTLDDDVLERVKQESFAIGASLRHTLNELLREALVNRDHKRAARKVMIKPFPMGYSEALNHESVEALIECSEGVQHR